MQVAFIFAGMRRLFYLICVLEVFLLAGCHKTENDDDLHIQYRQLKQFLQDYRDIREEGGWPVVNVKGILMAGVKDKQVEILRKRLAITGELKTRYSTKDATMFDDGVKKAVQQFQASHGLVPTGIVDKRTLFELNIPVDYRI